MPTVKAATASSPSTAPLAPAPRPLRELLGWLLVLAGAFTALSLASFDPHDDPARAFPVNVHPHNLGASFGRDLSGFLFDWVGALASYALALAAIVAGLRARRRAPAIEGPAPWPSLAFVRPFGLVVVLFALALVEHLLHRQGVLSGERLSGRDPGGVWGAFLAAEVLRSLPAAAGYGLATFAAAVGGVLALDVNLGAAASASAGVGAGSRMNPTLPPSSAGPSSDPAPRPLDRPATTAPRPHGSALGVAPIPLGSAHPPVAPAPRDQDLRPRATSEPAAAATPEGRAEVPRGAVPDARADVATQRTRADLVASPGPALARPEVRALPLKPVASAPAPAPEPAAAERPLDDVAEDAPAARERTFRLPPLSLLAPSSGGRGDEHESFLRERAALLDRTLQSFKIDARVVAVERGPNITQFEIELAPGVKVHRLLSSDGDIAIAMQASSVRIVAPIPGKSTIGVEVPNKDQDTVRLRELLEAGEHQREKQALPLFLGKDATGNPLVADLARMPHLLIAGATGSGKSVCMNTIITSLLLTKAPSELKLILIDPKMVELSPYQGVPHLLAPVVTDMRRAPGTLEWAVRQMEDRYRLLEQAQLRHVKDWNALPPEEIAARMKVPVTELAAAKIPLRLPLIVLVIDEFADLMCVAKKEVEGSIIRLAQKARAVGIHLICATQRPTADVITGLIKSNMPCRIAFQVASKVDSRNILDKNGAESLVGQGDMLFLPPGTSTVVRAQGAYVSDAEVKAIVDHVKAEGAPRFEPELLAPPPGEEAAAEEGAPGKGAKESEDPLFERAVEIILETQRGSASLLQRRLEVGYARASRLIDIMTERGVLGPFQGSKPREILVTRESWAARKGQTAEAA